jgi:hypothetical protein
MPNVYHMSWVASTRRWKKMFRGKMHVVSCRQLRGYPGWNCCLIMGYVSFALTDAIRFP